MSQWYFRPLPSGVPPDEKSLRRATAADAKRLQRLGVELRLNAAVEQVDTNGITAAGQRIESATVLWAAGVAASPAAGWFGLKLGRHGALPVEPDLSVPGHPSAAPTARVVAETNLAPAQSA